MKYIKVKDPTGDPRNLRAWAPRIETAKMELLDTAIAHMFLVSITWEGTVPFGCEGFGFGSVQLLRNERRLKIYPLYTGREPMPLRWDCGAKGDYPAIATLLCSHIFETGVNYRIALFNGKNRDNIKFDFTIGG